MEESYTSDPLILLRFSEALADFNAEYAFICEVLISLTADNELLSAESIGGMERAAQRLKDQGSSLQKELMQFRKLQKNSSTGKTHP